jgi:hypothetical protein
MRYKVWGKENSSSYFFTKGTLYMHGFWTRYTHLKFNTKE